MKETRREQKTLTPNKVALIVKMQKYIRKKKDLVYT